MAEESQQASSIGTWHCLCSTLILATPYDLEQLPTRASPAQDRAIVLPLPDETSATADAADGHSKSVLQNVTPDRKALIVRREDGFEKRVPWRCVRCKLVIGYKVLHKREGADGSRIFLLPGGLLRTEEMKEGRIPQPPV